MAAAPIPAHRGAQEAAGECLSARSRSGRSVTAAPFRRVLVGWDASADAVAALGAAAAITGRDGGHVVALAVVPQAWHAEEDEAERAATRRRVEEGFERARQAVPAVRSARVTLAIVEDARADAAVCGYAEDHGFDLVVLGRHGDGVAIRQRLGRVAEAAARRCAIPVLLVSER